MYNYVIGREVMIIGDLHISDRPVVGRHKNYLENCFTVLGRLRDEIKKRVPSAVVFLGDLVGTSERNIKSREVLSMLCRFFIDISNSEETKVFCIRGNHDVGDYPEFQFLSDIGMFETAVSSDGYFDYYGNLEQFERKEPEVRFHLVDYGNERKELALAGGNTTDIVLAHNNFVISGLTTWYKASDGIELGSLENMNGVYMVLSGHIHEPSPELYSTDMPNGSQCCLFYVGSPTRPAERYDKCWVVNFVYDKAQGCTDYKAEDFELPMDIFTEEELSEDLTEEDIMELERKEALKEVLDEIIQHRISTGDLIEQVERIPNASDEAKKVAKHYLQVALDNTAYRK